MYSYGLDEIKYVFTTGPPAEMQSISVLILSRALTSTAPTRYFHEKDIPIPNLR